MEDFQDKLTLQQQLLEYQHIQHVQRFQDHEKKNHLREELLIQVAVH